MDRLPGLCLSGKHLYSDLLQPLASQLSIELLYLHLSGQPKRALQLTERMLILTCLFVEVFGELPESVGTLPRLADSALETQVLLRQSDFGGIGRFNDVAHVKDLKEPFGCANGH